MICEVCGSQNKDDAQECSNPDCLFEFKSKFKGTNHGGPVVSHLDPGDLIGAKFLVERTLGQGGMGTVYQVEDSSLRHPYALKVLHPFLANDHSLVDRFKAEVLTCRDLVHENIVQVYEYQEWEKYHFFTMKYLDGKSLDSLLDQRAAKNSQFTLQESITVLDQVLSALAHAHEKTIHRDIKPANIMIQGKFPDIKVTVLDFGIARALSDSRFRKSAQAEGSFFYIAPEQEQGIVDERSDLYSAGAVFYKMLTGEPPAGRFPLPGEIIDTIPDGIDAFVDKVLSYRPDLRFESALKMQIALKKITDQQQDKIAPIISEAQPTAWTDPVTGMEFVWVEGGCFQMGSDAEDAFDFEKPVHKVCLDGFWMGKYEVTQGQWEQIMGSNPSFYDNGDNYPVENVSWNDCKKFISKLNQQSGQTFALPSEAQWEYAARSGGKDEIYSGGNDVSAVAWYDSNSGSSTHPVGTKAPNGLGIYDMSGNVYEWCEDVYDMDTYSRHARNNPLVTSGGSFRVFRGGCWSVTPACVRCADRGGSTPSTANGYLGFRLIRKE